MGFWNRFLKISCLPCCHICQRPHFKGCREVCLYKEHLSIPRKGKLNFYKCLPGREAVNKAAMMTILTLLIACHSRTRPPLIWKMYRYQLKSFSKVSWLASGRRRWVTHPRKKTLANLCIWPGVRFVIHHICECPEGIARDKRVGMRAAGRPSSMVLELNLGQKNNLGIKRVFPPRH